MKRFPTNTSPIMKHDWKPRPARSNHDFSFFLSAWITITAIIALSAFFGWKFL